MTLATADEEICELCRKNPAVVQREAPRAPIGGRTSFRVCAACARKLNEPAPFAPRLPRELMPRPDMPHDPRSVNRALRPPLAPPKLQA